MSDHTIDLQPIARNMDPHTSHESAEASKETHNKIAECVLSLAIARGRHGLTINEATDALPQFKAVSVSPVFRPLFNQGKLGRRVIGKTAKDQDKYETRVDPRTNCPGIIHYHFQVVMDAEPTASAEVVLPARKPPASIGRSTPATERRLRQRRQRDRRKSVKLSGQ